MPVVNGVTQRVLNDTFYSFTCLSEQTTKFSPTEKAFLANRVQLPVVILGALWIHRSQTVLCIPDAKRKSLCHLFVCLLNRTSYNWPNITQMNLMRRDGDKHI